MKIVMILPLSLWDNASRNLEGGLLEAHVQTQALCASRGVTTCCWQTGLVHATWVEI